MAILPGTDLPVIIQQNVFSGIKLARRLWGFVHRLGDNRSCTRIQCCLDPSGCHGELTGSTDQRILEPDLAEVNGEVHTSIASVAYVKDYEQKHSTFGYTFGPVFLSVAPQCISLLNEAL